MAGQGEGGGQRDRSYKLARAANDMAPQVQGRGACGFVGWGWSSLKVAVHADERSLASVRGAMRGCRVQ
jgi:hypothetical protein